MFIFKLQKVKIDPVSLELSPKEHIAKASKNELIKLELFASIILAENYIDDITLP